jgi:hypothetical protein
VVVAGAISEGIWEQKDLIKFAKHICKADLDDRKSSEAVNELWEATEVLHKRGEFGENDQELHYDGFKNRLLIHLPTLLAKIHGSQYTRHYEFPNKREVAKLLKLERYIKGYESARVNGKVAWRWVIPFEKPEELPESLQNIAKEIHGEGEDGSGGGQGDLI